MEIQRHGLEENRVTAKGFKHVVKKDTRSAGKKWFKVYRAKEIRGYRYVVQKDTRGRKKFDTNIVNKRKQGKGKNRMHTCGLKGYKEKVKKGYKYEVQKNTGKIKREG